MGNINALEVEKIQTVPANYEWIYPLVYELPNWLMRSRVEEVEDRRDYVDSNLFTSNKTAAILYKNVSESSALAIRNPKFHRYL